MPREELWYRMRKAGVTEKHESAIQDKYEGNRTAVRCAVVLTKWFDVKIGLYQGTAFSLSLFEIAIDRLIKGITEEESSWIMMFADDIVLHKE